MNPATCEHCGAVVIEAVFAGTGRVVHLDPEPLALGNLHLIDELGTFVRFILPERRQPTHRHYVPPEERYRSHRVTCVEHERTCTPDTTAFIDDVDHRLEARS